MFYRQCNNCNERWELGTTNICTCVTNGSATISYDKFSHLGQRTWVGLTDEEKDDFKWKWMNTNLHYANISEFIEAIEAKLKDKNT
jgi:hypothetical protein